jgi:hypothetical protein
MRGKRIKMPITAKPELRDYVLQVSLNQQELNVIAAAAKSDQRSVSTWVRMTALAVAQKAAQ